jgi:hypothetical protein
MRTKILLDANVLYPARLRDLWMELGSTGLAQIHWTARIETEWIEAVLRTRPELRKHLQRTAALMREHIPDAVITDFEGIEFTLSLPDADDRHVVAAAITSGAGRIATFNLKDFPEDAVRGYGISVCAPDDIFLDIAAADPEGFLSAVATVRARLKAPPVSADDYVAGLARAGCPRTAAMLAQRLEEL